MLTDIAMPTPTPATAAPRGARLVGPDGATLPLRRTHLDAHASGGLCRVVLTQTFVNPHAEPLHVTYHLPLPADGAVGGFSFVLGETRIEGEVQPRKKARAAFEAAIASGRTAALLEQDTASLFTQEVGNVPPGETVIVEVVVDQPLRWLDGLGGWEWRFPTVAGPRYFDAATTPTHTLDVSEGDTGARSALSLHIEDARTGEVRSSSHRLRTGQAGPPDDITFSDQRLDRDVVVQWPVAAPEVGATLDVVRLPRRDGDLHAAEHPIGLLTLVPPASLARPVPRDLILLLDTSGSMSGEPLAQLRRLATAMVEALGDEDRLEMIEFSTRPRRFQTEPMRTTRAGKKQARKWIAKLRASGGTEMLTAVHEALRPLRDDAARQVVLITDGYIGGEMQLVAPLLEDLPESSRLHVVGVGAAPNRALTRHAARAGRGGELFLDHGADVEPVLQQLLARTSAPALTDLRIEGAHVVAPARLPDLHAGSPVKIGLELSGGPVRVTGRTADGTFERTLEVPARALAEGPGQASTFFARERVADLEMERCVASDRAAFDRAIEAVALTHQIASRLTSWIAVTEEATVTPGTGRRVQQPQELPAGTSIEGLGLRAAVGDAAGVRTQTGVIGGIHMNKTVASRKRGKRRETAAPPPPMSMQMADDAGLDDVFEEEAEGFAEATMALPEPEPMSEAKPAPAPESTTQSTKQAALPSLAAPAEVRPGQASAPLSSVVPPPALDRCGRPWRLLMLVLVLVAIALAAAAWWSVRDAGPADAPEESAPSSTEAP